MSVWLSEEFTPKGFPVTTKEAEKGVDKLDSVSNARAKESLGIEFKHPKESLVDMVNALIAAGTIAPAKL